MRLPPLACDDCGRRADSVHFLRWVDNDHCAKVRFACSKHDPGGYWLELARFGREAYLLGHLAGKGFGALAKFAARLAEARDREDETWNRALKQWARENGKGDDGWIAYNLGSEFEEIKRLADAETERLIPRESRAT